MKLLLDWVSGLGCLVGIAVIIWLTMLLITREKMKKFSFNKQKVLMFVAGFILVAVIPWLFGHFIVHWFFDLFHSAHHPDGSPH